MTIVRDYTIILLFSKTKSAKTERGGNEINHKYTLIRSDVGGGVGVYGIRIETSAGNTVFFRYISPDKTQTVALMDRMSAASLSPVHFEDIVSDYITEQYYFWLEMNGLQSYTSL